MEQLIAALIDDDRQFCRTFKLLSKDFFAVTIATNSRDGLNLIDKRPPDVVFLDYRLKEDKNGLDVLYFPIMDQGVLALKKSLVIRFSIRESFAPLILTMMATKMF